MYCSGCGHQVTAHSKFCTGCGRPIDVVAVALNTKRTRPFLRFAWFVFGMVALGAIGSMIFAPSTTAPAASQPNKVSNARFYLASLGAKMLREAMRNPDSFKFTSVSIIDATGAVCYEYRAQNGFGGMNSGSAVLTPKGGFKSSEMDGFTSLWNRECAHKQGTEQVDAINDFISRVQ